MRATQALMRTLDSTLIVSSIVMGKDLVLLGSFSPDTFIVGTFVLSSRNFRSEFLNFLALFFAFALMLPEGAEKPFGI